MKTLMLTAALTAVTTVSAWAYKPVPGATQTSRPALEAGVEARMRAMLQEIRSDPSWAEFRSVCEQMRALSYGFEAGKNGLLAVCSVREVVFLEDVKISETDKAHSRSVADKLLSRHGFSYDPATGRLTDKSWEKGVSLEAASHVFQSVFGASGSVTPLTPSFGPAIRGQER